MATLLSPLRAAAIGLALLLAITHAQSQTTNAAPDASKPAASAEAPASAAIPLLKDAFARLNQGDVDGALLKIDAAVQIDPKNVNIYLIRGSVYGKKKIWARAQRDYETALSLEPNKAIIKFNLAELCFMQRFFEKARPGFAALQKDPELGDLAAYKVFLCDVMLARDDAAKADLATFNQVGGNPSYYYANAAWDLSHNKPDEAMNWLKSAKKIYSKNKNDLYAFSLIDLATLRTPFVSFVTLAGKKYENVQALLEENDLRVLTPDGWIVIPFEQLPATLTSFPEDWQYKIAAKRSADTDPGITVPLLTTKSGQKYANSVAFVENTGLRLRTDAGFVSVPFAQLPDDLSVLPPDLQKQIANRRRPDADALLGVKVPAFTTRQGQKYENVDVVVEETDIRVHAPSGWVIVPFTQLPDDLSVFPIDLQNEITAKRTPPSDAVAGISVPLLTTRQGRKYENVSAFVENSGLRLRTSGGMVSVPFDQLPEDLSALPPDLQKQIAAKRRPATNVLGGGIPVPSLQTRNGKAYANVIVFVENAGLRMQTSDGWVSLPFEQLPDDLSSYPPDLQRQIAAKRRPPAESVTGISLASLTTKQGKTYSNVEVFVENSGLRVRTKDGWINLPFDQLPADLSSYPTELKKQIAAKRPSAMPESNR